MGNRPAVLIRGDGVAAYCCAHLLGQARIPVALDRPSRPRLPAIMLSEAAIRLIADVFGRERLFDDLPRIRNRAVLWGLDAAPVTLPHSAVVVSEQTLLDSIRPESAGSALEDALEWNIFASRPLPPGCIEQGFGSRIARAAEVEMKQSEAPGCWIESLEDGWLFLIGSGDGKGWLLSVGGADLGRSRLIAAQIVRAGQCTGEFPVFPRMIVPLSGKHWLACGSAAIAFDPLCGDGTAHAVREAILAAAAIRAIFAGASVTEVSEHYESRLTAGFQRHLIQCEGFYRTGGTGPWWNAELRAVERGRAWCNERMSRFGSFRYRLNGYELEEIAGMRINSA